MRQYPVSIVIVAFLIALVSLPDGQALAMSLFEHHHDDGGSQSGVNQNVGKSSVSNFQSIDAQPYVTPVPEPSTVVLLGSGVAALGLWRWKKKE